MEKATNNNQNDKRKTIILTTIGLITLIGLVIGATYAFINVTGTNSSTPTNVTGQTEGLGVASLTNPTPSLHINLQATDMNLANKGKAYYATDDTNKNYDATLTKRSIAVAGITGGEANTKNQCTSTIDITLDGTMKDVINAGDGKLILTPSSGIEIDTTEIDLKTLADKGTITLPVVYKIAGNKEEKIEAVMLINNSEEDQLALAGKSLSINITNTSFKCEIVQDFIILNKFYINDETSNKSTQTDTVNIHLEWEDEKGSEYCILENDNNSDNCTWVPVGDTKTIDTTYTLKTDGTTTIYAYLKNSEGAIAIKSDSIEYKPIKTGAYLISHPITDVLEPTGVEEDELATRYYGTNPPNYICFGTTNKSTCTGDQDKYMYRIIGVDKSGRYKVIKKETLNTAYAWHSNTNTTWADAALKTNLNGSYFLTNSTYMPSGWSDKIETMAWKYGGFTDANKTAAQMIQIEQAWTSTTSAKIGLMYLADYYYAYQKAGLNCSGSGQYGTCKTSWMHLSQNDKGAPSGAEWTMSRYGSGLAWCVDSNGRVGNFILNTTYSVRSVFYLKSNITIDGTGTQSDPYMIISG